MSLPLTAGLEPARKRPRGRAALGLVAVLLPLAVAVVYSGPRVWKSVRSEPSSAVAVASLPAQQPAAAAQIPVEQSPRPAPGQLANLGRFAARDPFASPLPAAAAGGAAAAAIPSPPATSAVPATPAASAAPATPAAPTASAALATPAASPSAASPVLVPVAPAPVSATISVNGVPEAIRLKALFPAADPLFRLVALGADEVQISVVGGATPGAPTPGTTSGLTPGVTSAAAPGTTPGATSAAAPVATPVAEQTVTLVRDRTLTLLDTVSGARYELRLVTLP